MFEGMPAIRPAWTCNEGTFARTPSGPPCWHCGRPSVVDGNGEGFPRWGVGSCRNFDCRPTHAQQIARAAKLYGGGAIGEMVLVFNHNRTSFAEMLAAADSVGEGAALREWHANWIADGMTPCW